MIDVEIKTTERTIQEKIKDWKELETLLLKYKDYISMRATDTERLKEHAKRNTR